MDLSYGVFAVGRNENPNAPATMRATHFIFNHLFRLQAFLAG